MGACSESLPAPAPRTFRRVQWGEQDLNLRSLRHLVYSQAPLATWVSPRDHASGVQ